MVKVENLSLLLSKHLLVYFKIKERLNINEQGKLSWTRDVIDKLQKEKI